MSINSKSLDKEYFSNISTIYSGAKKNHSKDTDSEYMNKVFIDVLKGSHSDGMTVDSNSFGEIQKTYKEMKEKNEIDISDVLILDTLEEDIDKYYRDLGKKSLDRKHSEAKNLSKIKRKQEKSEFNAKRGTSPEPSIRLM